MSKLSLRVCLGKVWAIRWHTAALLKTAVVCLKGNGRHETAKDYWKLFQVREALWKAEAKQERVIAILDR